MTTTYVICACNFVIFSAELCRFGFADEYETSNNDSPAHKVNWNTEKLCAGFAVQLQTGDLVITVHLFRITVTCDQSVLCIVLELTDTS